MKDPSSSQAARLKGLEKYSKWEKEAIKLFPALEADFAVARETTTAFESLPVCLPSLWHAPHDRCARGFGSNLDDAGSATHSEFILRYGQAHDSLHGVRESIKIWYYGLWYKRVDNLDSSNTTRASEYVASLAASKTNHAEKYRRSYQAMLRLGLNPRDSSEFQVLVDEQLRMRDAGKKRGLGSGKEPDPWFWTVGCPKDAEPEEWSVEGEQCLSC